MRRPSLIAAIALAIVFGAVFLPARASAEGLQDGLTLIAVDQGAAPAPADLDAAETALLTVAPSLTAGGVGLMTYAQQPGEFRLLRPGPDTMLAVKDTVAQLRKSVGPYKSGQFEALSAGYAHMNRLGAPDGSRLVLITTGRIDGESEATPSRLRSLGELYAREGWRIEVITLPSTIAPLRELMEAVARASGGKYYDLGSPEGVTALLSDRQGLTLTRVIDAELGDGVRSYASVDVAPHTSDMRVVFVRSSGQTTVNLYRPNGEPLNLNVAGNSVIETPNAVVYSVTSPAAGTWRLEGAGAGSKLVAAADIRNPLQLRLLDEPPTAVGTETTLRAMTSLDGQPQALPGATVTARVRRSDGTASVYELNDAGAGADALANDGVFSALLPPSVKQGFNDVSLELTWLDLEAVVRAAGVYRTEVFPTLQVVQEPSVRGTLGEKVLVGTVRVSVGQYPHLVKPSDLIARLVGPQGMTEASLEPLAIIEDGKAWEFAIRAAPPASGQYTVSVVLDSAHLGRDFTATAPAFSAVATISPRPVTLLGLPVWAWAALAVVIAGLALVIAYSSRQVRPYGYIYDDQDRIVVDFSRMHGNLTHWVFARNHVAAREVPGMPFQGGEFLFNKCCVVLRYERAPGDPSIRVNGHPASEPLITLGEDVWLGAGGRLLRFVPERKPGMAMAAVPASAPGDGG